MQEFIEKLKESLEKNGIDEETAKAILDDLDKAEEAKPEEEVQAVEVEETPVPEEAEEQPKPEEVEEAVAVEATPEAEELPPEAEEPKVEPIPQADPEKEELRADLDELKKANEGLLARVDSLEEALRDAGVIEGEKQPKVGYAKPAAPANDGDDDGGLEAFIHGINRHR